MITIGIDPHKASVTAAAIDPNHQPLDHQRLPVDPHTTTRLLAWADRWPQRRWAVEGAAGLGHTIAQQLLAAGETVLDVPATLAARARLLGTGSTRKTDLADARSAATVALCHPRLRQVAVEDHLAVIRLLSDHRDDLTAERTRTVNRLHVLLRDLHPGGAKRALSATHAARLLARLQPTTVVDTHRVQIASQLLDSVRRLDAELKANQTAIGKAIRASHTTLTRLHGVGVLLAAKIIAHTGDLHRFPDRGHYASYNGSAPIEASSGDRCRHRLNRGGNRQLNSALHIIAVCQIRDPGPGQAYYQRKLAEGKTPAEARRALKRRISDAVYRCLHADHQSCNRPAA